MNVTMGKEGSIAFYEGKEVFQKPFLQENTIETTGAGDTFGACALNYVLEHGREANISSGKSSTVILQNEA